MASGPVVYLLCGLWLLSLYFIGTHVDGASESLDTIDDTDNITIGWETWLAWSDCTRSCGKGEKLRVRLCRSFAGDNSTECTHSLQVDENDTIGYLVDIDPCDLQACPVDGQWGAWSNWSECSATCDSGNRNRKRVCEGQTLGGSPCEGSPLQVETCVMDPCPVDNEPVVPPPGARNNMEIEVTQSDKRTSAITLGSFVIVFMVLECVVLLLADFVGIIKFLCSLKDKMKAKAKAKAKAHKIQDSNTELNTPLDVKEVNIGND